MTPLSIQSHTSYGTSPWTDLPNDYYMRLQIAEKLLQVPMTQSKGYSTLDSLATADTPFDLTAIAMPYFPILLQPDLKVLKELPGAVSDTGKINEVNIEGIIEDHFRKYELPLTRLPESVLKEVEVPGFENASRAKKLEWVRFNLLAPSLLSIDKATLEVVNRIRIQVGETPLENIAERDQVANSAITELYVSHVKEMSPKEIELLAGGKPITRGDIEELLIIALVDPSKVKEPLILDKAKELLLKAKETIVSQLKLPEDWKAASEENSIATLRQNAYEHLVFTSLKQIPKETRSLFHFVLLHPDQEHLLSPSQKVDYKNFLKQLKSDLQGEGLELKNLPLLEMQQELDQKLSREGEVSYIKRVRSLEDNKTITPEEAAQLMTLFYRPDASMPLKMKELSQKLQLEAIKEVQENHHFSDTWKPDAPDPSKIKSKIARYSSETFEKNVADFNPDLNPDQIATLKEAFRVQDSSGLDPLLGEIYKNSSKYTVENTKQNFSLDPAWQPSPLQSLDKVFSESHAKIIKNGEHVLEEAQGALENIRFNASGSITLIDYMRIVRQGLTALRDAVYDALLSDAEVAKKRTMAAFQESQTRLAIDRAKAEEMKKKREEMADAMEKQESTQLGMNIFLTIITVGIYGIIWGAIEASVETGSLSRADADEGLGIAQMILMILIIIILIALMVVTVGQSGWAAAAGIGVVTGIIGGTEATLQAVNASAQMQIEQIQADLARMKGALDASMAELRSYLEYMKKVTQKILQNLGDNVEWVKSIQDLQAKLWQQLSTILTRMSSIDRANS